jgi:deoxyribodipyrimidine photo-lyase
VRPDGSFVLYWMVAARRLQWNYAVQRAAELAAELARPLLILEPLDADYPWASDRHHAFVMQGMLDNAREAADAGVAYYPYVEPAPKAGAGLLRELAKQACAVITDEFPAFFLPALVAGLSRGFPARLEQVDSNGTMPLRGTDRAYGTAYAFRRFLHRELGQHLAQAPDPHPLLGLDLPRLRTLPEEVVKRWQPAAAGLLEGDSGALSVLPLDHGVPAAEVRGGATAAAKVLRGFLRGGLDRYAAGRNALDDGAASGLSPYFHFGHLSTHQVVQEVAAHEEWTPFDLRPEERGSRGGWGMREDATEFVDQLVTWRELGYNMCAHRPDYDQFASLPDWARLTLDAHRSDPREHFYTLEQFEGALTHDALWNAAQTQLLREGRIHNYLRMLWGKKILEWSASPEDALQIMVQLNNKYALDGRDPNSYSGIFWVLGRYDRPWGPERPVFGKVRYMSSANTARKLRVRGYIQRYANGPESALA